LRRLRHDVILSSWKSELSVCGFSEKSKMANSIDQRLARLHRKLLALARQAPRRILPAPPAHGSNVKSQLERFKSRLNYDEESGHFYWRQGILAGQLAGSRHNGGRGYWTIGIGRKRYLAHRLAWLFKMGEWPWPYIDHINGNGMDNRLCNLRLATRSQNYANGQLRSTNKTGFKGVHLVHLKDRLRYGATISFEGKKTSLGTFNSAKGAHIAYLVASRRLFGEFARGARSLPLWIPPHRRKEAGAWPS
jgi:hypothetical protein